MRIAYTSDLHLEFDSTIMLTGLSTPAMGTTADVLVLAGNVDRMLEYYTELLRRLLEMSAISQSEDKLWLACPSEDEVEGCSNGERR